MFALWFINCPNNRGASQLTQEIIINKTKKYETD
jgi:hypothetical protein